MTNYEIFEKKIKEWILTNKENLFGVAKSNKQIYNCSDMACSDCMFCSDNADGTCFINRANWLQKTVKTNWDAVPIDTPVIFTDIQGNLHHACFAGYDIAGECTSVFADGRNSFTANDVSIKNRTMIVRKKSISLVRPEDVIKYASDNYSDNAGGACFINRDNWPEEQE